jgi:UDP-3-O-[3-hydroxymyristoyl] glucosamine N-acyltransferase
MPFSLKEIASKVNGRVLGKDCIISNIASLYDAKESSLSFLLENTPVKDAERTKACALVVQEKITIKDKSLIQVKDPRIAMLKIISMFEEKISFSPGIDPTAIIKSEAKVSPEAYIGPYTVISKGAAISKRAVIYSHVFIGENVEIGEDTIVYPHVAVYPNSIIGNRSIIHAGCIVGVDGYGFVAINKKQEKIPQIGRAVIGDDCEIYSNACVARATLGETLVGDGTKIDALSQVGHNCKIGKNCIITSLVGLSGSVSLGDNVVVGGQSGFKDHVKVGDNTFVAARAGVTKNVPANSIVSGFPAQDHKKELEQQAKIKKLLKER